MGANAQTSVPAFTAGQVLTAQQQTEINTGVPVFADATARNAAFGGTGEKTLAEGQLAYLEDSNIVQYYDGSNWLTLAPSAAPGLELVKAQTIGTTVSSVTVTDAFNSTYENYLVRVDGGVGSTEITLQLTLGAANANYRYSFIYIAFNTNTVQGDSNNSTSNFPYCGYATSTNINAKFDVFSPNTAKNTIVHSTAVRPASNGQNGILQGVLSDTTQFTAFTLTASVGTLTGGTIRVYGYKN